MDVYVVLYDSCDGEEPECHGVFANKLLAEKRIQYEIAKWGNDFTFIRNNDRWVLDHEENGYWIVTTQLETNFDIKEPEHI
jgi:hypothetical protein